MALKIVGAGNGRTGTTSMKLALEHLGFGPCYHMYELFEHPERASYWHEANKTGTTDWDAALAGYESSVDYPAYRLYKEIYDHFPGCKVILTTRDPESWYESASKTIFTAAPNPLQKLKILARLPFSRRMRQLMPVFQLIDYLWDEVYQGKLKDKEYMINAFLNFEEEVKSTIPKEDLLVYPVGSGWEPLCAFLNVNVPDVPYPKANTRNSFAENIKNLQSGGMPNLS